MEFQKPVGLLRQAYYQGHGRYVNQLARLTLKFCKNSGSSREVRKFIETGLVDMARDNPGTVIYIKPRLFKTPVLTGEYLNGQQHYLSLYNMSKDQVAAWMNWFLTRSGEDLYKIKLPVRTAVSSVQGHWTPFTNKDPKTIITSFPNDELGKHKSEKLTATEQLLEIYSKSN